MGPARTHLPQGLLRPVRKARKDAAELTECAGLDGILAIASSLGVPNVPDHAQETARPRDADSPREKGHQEAEDYKEDLDNSGRLRDALGSAPSRGIVA